MTDPPAGGPYTSTSRAVIRRHLKQMTRAGVDFVVVNWHVDFRGPARLEVEATRRLMEEIERARLPMKICLLLAFNAEDPEVIRSTIRKARREFMKEDAYLEHGGQPVLWLLLNDPFRGFLFHYRADLEKLTRGLQPGGDRLDRLQQVHAETASRVLQRLVSLFSARGRRAPGLGADLARELQRFRRRRRADPGLHDLPGIRRHAPDRAGSQGEPLSQGSAKRLEDLRADG